MTADVAAALHVYRNGLASALKCYRFLDAHYYATCIAIVERASYSQVTAKYYA